MTRFQTPTFPSHVCTSLRLDGMSCVCRRGEVGLEWRRRAGVSAGMVLCCLYVRCGTVPHLGRHARVPRLAFVDMDDAAFRIASYRVVSYRIVRLEETPVTVLYCTVRGVFIASQLLLHSRSLAPARLYVRTCGRYL